MAKKDKRKVTSYCDWMSQLPPEFHNIPLYDLAIPGSHDSMSYDLDINSSIIEPDRLKRLSKIYCVRKIVRKWAITQEETITKQLDAGVRYFDLRIARKARDPDPTRLYFCHGLCTRTDVETVLKVICDWAERHPKEILILALSNFKGFDKAMAEQLHRHLIGFILKLFGAKLIHIRVPIQSRCGDGSKTLRYQSMAGRHAPRLEKSADRHLLSDTPTLRSCWDKGRNVIVSYDYPTNQHVEIWSKIPYFYGDTMSTAKVESKLRHVLETARPVRYFFVCGLNLTLPENARLLLYILRLCDNLANVIRRGLPRLLQWVKGQAAKTPVNIVASDLVTRDDFVPTVIELNASKSA